MADQHYVWKFYLNAWVDPASERPKCDPYLWFFDVETGEVKSRAPANICVRGSYYEWETPELKEHESPEQLYSKVENDAVPVFRKLRRGEWPLTDHERYELAKYMAFQLTRVPRWREQAELGVKDGAEEAFRSLFRDDKRFAGFVQHKYGASDPALVTAERKRLQVILDALDEGRVIVKPAKDRVMAIQLKAALMWIPVIGTMQFSRVHAHARVPFITTDQPVSTRSWDGVPIDIDFVNLVNTNLELTLAVSPDLLIVAHQRPPHEQEATADTVRANKTNILALESLNRFAICRSKAQAEWIKKTLKDWQRAVKWAAT